jgi:hypothetical protein
MANPTIVNRQDTDGGSTFTKPTGLADNDVLYLMFNAFGDNLVQDNSVKPSAPSGFTEIYCKIRGQGDGTGHPRACVTCYRKIITNAAGEPANYTVGAPGGGYGASAYQGGSIYAVRGADTATPEADSAGVSGKSVTADTGSIIDSSGTDWLLFVNCTNMVTLSPGTPSGMTNDFNGDTGDARVYSQSSSGSALSSAQRTSSLGTDDSWVIGFVVVKPAASGNSTATPSAVATVTAVPAPTLKATSVATPAAVATVAAVPAPTIRIDQAVTPATVATVVAIPAPTLTTTSKATPAAVATVVTVPAPTLIADATATPSAVTTVTAVPAPTPLTSGNSTATPATVVTVAAIPAPTPTATSKATPAAVVTVVAVPAPTLSSSRTATPATVVTVAAVPAPTPKSTVVATPAVVITVVGVPAPGIVAAAKVTVTPVVTTTSIPAPSISTNPPAPDLVNPLTVETASTRIESDPESTELTTYPYSTEWDTDPHSTEWETEP